MGMTGTELKSLIERHEMDDVKFTGIMHVGNELYLKDGELALPDEFNFTGGFSNEVWSASKFGENYLIRQGITTSMSSVEETKAFIQKGCWNLVLVF